MSENADQARHIVHGPMKAVARRDGRVIYCVTGGGVVSDDAVHVRVPQPTDHGRAVPGFRDRAASLK